MKEGWIVKKLGEVCNTSSGGTPSKSHSEYYDGGTIPWLRSGEISKGNIYETELFITEEGLKKSSAKIFPINTVVIAMYGATVGQIGILKKEMSTNQAVCGIYPNDVFSPDFLAYVLKNKKEKFILLASGGAQPNISQTIINQTYIPVPPLSEQSRIVEELDLLSNIIEKKRQQLSELDNLAQSIFYDMFGDPVTNEKGWEVKTVGQLFELKAGKAIKAKELANEYEDGLYACYGGNGIRGYIPKFSHSGCYPIIGRQGALCGNVNLAKGDFYATEHAVVVSCNGNADAVWTYYCMVLMNLNRYAKGVAQPGISVNVINAVNIILPSLELQQLFAQKIKAIEKQKALIKQSIAETEELFNSRMDYYFS